MKVILSNGVSVNLSAKSCVIVENVMAYYMIPAYGWYLFYSKRAIRHIRKI